MKMPRPQAIARLLRTAQFPRATTTHRSSEPGYSGRSRARRGRRENMAGYHVGTELGEVCVTYWARTGHPVAVATELGMLTRYAKVITAAGWPVRAKLVISVPAEFTPGAVADVLAGEGFTGFWVVDARRDLGEILVRHNNTADRTEPFTAYQAVLTAAGYHTRVQGPDLILTISRKADQ